MCNYQFIYNTCYLDGWCEGGLRQQRNDSGGCVTMREGPVRVESPGTYVIE